VLKFKGSPFYVPTPLGERLIIPPKYVEELKGAPIEDVDFVGAFFEVENTGVIRVNQLTRLKMFKGKYTTIGSRSQLHPRVTRLQLNQNIGS
jgi:hypothetical protein